MGERQPLSPDQISARNAARERVKLWARSNGYSGDYEQGLVALAGTVAEAIFRHARKGTDGDTGREISIDDLINAFPRYTELDKASLVAAIVGVQEGISSVIDRSIFDDIIK